MNRRSFLQQASIAAMALAVDPEKLLWTPTKTIFLPPKQGWRDSRYPHHRVWYVNPAAKPGGDGTSERPFQTISAWEAFVCDLAIRTGDHSIASNNLILGAW